MVRYSLIAVFVLLVSSYVQGQFNIPQINKLKEIRLLKSHRYEVQNLLSDFELQQTDEKDHVQRFTTDNYSIKVRYSFGNCIDDYDIWNVGEWIVTEISIEPIESPLPLKELGYDLSKLSKERQFVDQPNSYLYFSKKLGFAFDVNESKIWRISIFGPNNLNVKPCDNEVAKMYLSNAKWFVDSKLDERYVSHGEAPAASVTELTLSRSDFEYTSSSKLIDVVTTANVDEEVDVITFQYTVSGGKIIGNGPKVIWNLSSVQPGKYTITAGVDDGCGVCGRTITKTVVIK